MRKLAITPSYLSTHARSLEIYFNDVSRISLLSPEDEVVLSRKAQEGDEQSLHAIICANQRFVISVAKKYQNQGIQLGDLINEGNFGLMAAAKRFDPARGFKFISFAVWWIRQSIIFAIEEQSRPIHLPYNLVTLKGKAEKVRQNLEQQLFRKPTYEEISAILGESEYKISELMYFDQKQLSINHQVNNETGQTLLEIHPCTDQLPDKKLMSDSLKSALSQSLIILNKRDKKIIKEYFGLNQLLPMSLDHIASDLCLSVEQTRRLKDNALLKIRNSSYGELLQLYLI